MDPTESRTMKARREGGSFISYNQCLFWRVLVTQPTRPKDHSSKTTLDVVEKSNKSRSGDKRERKIFRRGVISFHLRDRTLMKKLAAVFGILL